MQEEKYYQLQALAWQDSLNEAKTAKYHTFTKDKVVYFVLDPTHFDLARLCDYIKRFCLTNQHHLEVDLKSFLALLPNVDFKHLLVVLISAFCFYQKTPFTCKSQTTEAKYKLKFLADSEHKEILEQAMVLSEVEFFCRRLQDMPSNMLDPAGFVNEIKAQFCDVADLVKISVLNQEELKKQQLNLLLGVNQGSSKEAFLLCVEYNQAPQKSKYALVGKGILFDSGGMNIKTMQFMRHMKFDMSGAATVMGVVYALAKNKIAANVVAVAPLTENAIGANALRPDDIIISHAQKTVEIDNTDAEGRLVLADALSYAAKTFKPACLVSIATLTGAIRISLGDTYSGVWTSCEQDWKAVKKSANAAGDYVWRLPLHEDFLALLKSQWADLTNSVNDLRANSSRAACFLEQFCHDLPFIHFDVASTTTKNNQGQAALLKTLYYLVHG